MGPLKSLVPGANSNSTVNAGAKVWLSLVGLILELYRFYLLQEGSVPPSSHRDDEKEQTQLRDTSYVCRPG